ncbi:hypothetical protein AAH978_05675 [Streptomyces sp. ZYX-F-203]
MAEHEAEREGDEQRRRPVEGRPDHADETRSAGSGVPGGPSEGAPQDTGDEPGGEGARERTPLDEDAAWASIVAGYGSEPPDPPGAKPFKSVEDLALLEAAPGEERPGPEQERPASARPLGGSVAFAPGVGTGPRDHSLPEPSDDDFGEGDEGHFVPPEPPPLPEADVTAKFAWLGVIGGPVLLLLAVVLDWHMTWWLTTLSVGGFLGGFATLVTRLRTDDEDDEDPGRGAVV